MSAAQAGAASLGMQSENFGYSRVRLRRIKKLQFGVVDPNELVSYYLTKYFCFSKCKCAFHLRILFVLFLLILLSLIIYQKKYNNDDDDDGKFV
jgi:hypothetical protein